MWYIIISLLGMAISFIIGITAMQKRVIEKANYFKRDYAYRLPIGNKLYVVMEEEDYNNFKIKKSNKFKNMSEEDIKEMNEVVKKGIKE